MRFQIINQCSSRGDTMINKVKKGSSLVSVLVTLGILITVGTAVMSLSVSDYKSRIVESKRVKNLYESESGLEEAYGVLGSIVDEAVDEGNKKVDEYMVNLKEALKEDNIVKVQNSVFKPSYRENVKSNMDKIMEEDSGIILNHNENSPEVKIINLKEDIKFNDKGILTLVLQSSFTTESPEGKKQQRIIKATYNIETPDYNNPYAVETEKVSVPMRSVWSKALVVEKNLNANGDLTVNGDIFVRGNTNSSGDEGIIISGENNSLNISGNAVTLKDTLLSSPSNIFDMNNINGSLYTGSLSIQKSASGSNINIKGSVYANNDLVLNGVQSNITIEKGFYGFNDVSGLKEGDNKEKNSSSILVNAGDIGNGSSITIGGEAMLMGTAYIKTDPNYQTGESVAIKGNYRAYSAPLQSDPDKNLNEDNVVLEYISPLQLVTKFKDNNELNFKDKSKYFELYSKTENNKLKINGISLPDKTIRSGSIITTDSKGKAVVLGENYTNDELSNIKAKKDNYLQAVGEVDAITQEIDFNKINQPIEVITSSKDETEVICVKNDSKAIVLTKEGYNSASGEKVYLKDGKGKGIIITKGDVYLDGPINFSGAIITEGNLIVTGVGKKELNYDAEYLKKLIALNLNKFEGLFKKPAPSDYQMVEIRSDIKSDNKVISTLRNNYITTQNWKIIK